MHQTEIKFSFTKIIGPDYKSPFEKNVFEDSYQEFLLQSQAYNPGQTFRTFNEMVNNNPKANSLHYKVGFAVGLYIRELQHMIPDLYDNSGDASIIFSTCEFRIRNSAITSKKEHLVSLTFTTGTYFLLDHFGEYLLISAKEEMPGNILPTTILRMQPGLSIAEVVSKSSVESPESKV